MASPRNEDEAILEPHWMLLMVGILDSPHLIIHSKTKHILHAKNNYGAQFYCLYSFRAVHLEHLALGHPNHSSWLDLESLPLFLVLETISCVSLSRRRDFKSSSSNYDIMSFSGVSGGDEESGDCPLQSSL